MYRILAEFWDDSDPRNEKLYFSATAPTASPNSQTEVGQVITHLQLKIV